MYLLKQHMAQLHNNDVVCVHCAVQFGTVQELGIHTCQLRDNEPQGGVYCIL